MGCPWALGDPLGVGEASRAGGWEVVGGVKGGCSLHPNTDFLDSPSIVHLSTYEFLDLNATVAFGSNEGMIAALILVQFLLSKLI